MKKSRIILSALTCVGFAACLAACSLGMPKYDDGYESNGYADGFFEIPNGGELPESGDRFDEIVDNPFVKTAEENVSTFSLDADTAAYSYMRMMLSDNRLPDENSVRIEEYLNYFTFDYKDPEEGETVSLNSEVGPCPWNTEHKTIRLGIKGKSVKEEDLPLCNYVFLIDVSGSMDVSNKLPLLKKGLITMLDYMNPEDRISIVTYSGKEKLELESTTIKNKELIKSKIKALSADGCTNGADAIKMAYKEALDHYIVGGNNRIIMGTDGDFNVGTTSTDDLLELVESYASAEKSVYLTVCGFGSGNLNDEMMEKVSNKGNGTYVYVDSETEMTKVFVDERSRFITVANDCKTQVTFSKDYVAEYRLIGYENRMLQNEDFEDDTKDAAEVGAGQTITALYEIVPTEAFEDAVKENLPIATFDFRYKEDLKAESKLLSNKVSAVSEEYSENMKFAHGVTAFCLVLRNSKYKGNASVKMALELLEDSKKYDPYNRRKEFRELVAKASELISKRDENNKN